MKKQNCPSNIRVKKTIALLIGGILANAVQASVFIVAGWDFWDGGSTKIYDATVFNGVSAQAVGTDRDGIGWGHWNNPTFNNGASGDGTWGTVTGDVVPSTSTADPTAAVGLRNSTGSGELTFTITNTSGYALDLASFHFDGMQTRAKAPGDWTLSILAGSGVTQGLVTSGVLPLELPMPIGGINIDLTELADRTLDNGETVIFELAFTGGAGDGSGGQNTMIDNVALMAAGQPSTGPGETIVRPFHQIIGAVNFRDNYYSSSWFGRFQMIREDIIHSGLGRMWTGAASNASSMFFWAYEFNQWIWTTASVYPHLYLFDDEEWIYAYEIPDFGTLLWNYNQNGWAVLQQAGWEYPRTNDELAQQMFETISDVPHPRILLSLDHLPTLRENINEGWLADAYSVLKTTADQHKASFANSIDFIFSATVGRRMQDTIATLALVGYIEDDDSYIRSAIDFTLHQINTHSYEEFADNNPGSPPLSLGDVVHGLAIAYDWLNPHMTTSERAEIHTALETLGGMLYTVVRNRYSGTSDVADSSNHNAVGNGGLGMGALALGDKPAWFSQAIRQTRRYLDVSSDAEGWNFEGRSYFNYGGWGAFPFASAVTALGGPDLFAEQPKYDSVAVDYLLRQMVPYVGATGTAATMPFIMRSRDEVGLWVWLNGNGPNGNRSYGEGGSGISFLPYNILWADPHLQPLHPMDADLPLDKVFPSDRALFRDGWDPMDAVVTFTTGWAWHPGHRVRNDNSFNFYALGERFAISPADAQTRMEVLNSLVMVDEPRRTLDPQEFRHGAAFEIVETNEDFAYLKSDASESPVYYLEPDGWTAPEKRKVSHAMRHLLFARSPEGLAEPYILIMDDLTVRAESAKFSWLFQTEAQNTPHLDESGKAFQVTGRFHGNRLDVQFLAPAELSNELLSHVGRNEIKGRWSDQRVIDTFNTISTSTTGKSVRFIALLRAHEAGTPPPPYTFTGSDTNGQIVVNLSDGTTDTITINGEAISFSRVSP